MPSNDAVTSLISSADRIRTTAGWLLASLGAAASALLVGADLSALKDVDDGSDLRFALLGVIIAVAAAGRAIFMTAQVLAPAQHVDRDGKPAHAKDDERLKTIVASEPILLAGLADDVATLWNDHEQRIRDLNDAQDAYIAHPTDAHGNQVKVATARMQVTEAVVAHLRALALYEQLRERFREATRSIAWCSLGVVLGVLLFNLAVHDLLDIVV